MYQLIKDVPVRESRHDNDCLEAGSGLSETFELKVSRHREWGSCFSPTSFG